MPEEDASNQKRSAFVEDEKIEKINRTLRKDAVVDESKLIKQSKLAPKESTFDSAKNVIKNEEFCYNPKPFVVGGTTEPGMKEPEVEVVKDTNGNVMKIRVKCTCGREVDIDCVY